MSVETGAKRALEGTSADLLTLCRSEQFGLCVRALVSFKEGAILHKFLGRIGPHLSQHSLQISPGRHISGTRFVGFLTHGCDPNCRLDMERFALIARRDIPCGELLTIDYAATEDVLYRHFACECGAPNCRGWIIGRRETIVDERSREPVSGERALAVR